MERAIACCVYRFTTLATEVAAFIEEFKDELDGAGRRLVVRNGFHAPQEVATAAG